MHARQPDRQTARAEDGVALVVQLSYLSQRRTEPLLAEHVLSTRVLDVRVFGGNEARRRQIEHVERFSDAYHLKHGSEEATVAYLLEISRRPEAERPAPPAGN